jgi:hypothetical protein
MARVAWASVGIDLKTQRATPAFCSRSSRVHIECTVASIAGRSRSLEVFARIVGKSESRILHQLCVAQFRCIQVLMLANRLTGRRHLVEPVPFPPKWRSGSC